MVIHVIDVGRLRTWQLRESEIWPNNVVEAFPGGFRSGPEGDALVDRGDAGKHLGTTEGVHSAQLVVTATSLRWWAGPSVTRTSKGHALF